MATAGERELHRVFIDIEVDDSAARDVELASKLEEVCPVDIYATNEDGTLRIVDENVDECVLCALCIEASPPGAVRVVKRYDGTKLER